jgi:hypothetical protein
MLKSRCSIIVAILGKQSLLSKKYSKPKLIKTKQQTVRRNQM